MKKIICLSLMLFLFPIMVSAAVVNITYYTEPGDVIFKNNEISFSKRSNDGTNFNIYLDNELVNDDVTTRGSYYYYAVPKDVVIKTIDYNGGRETLDITIYLDSLDLTNIKVHCYIDEKKPSEVNDTYYMFDKNLCDDYIEEGNYYSSNDILLKYSETAYSYYYDKDGKLIGEDYDDNPTFGAFSYSQAAFLPKNNNKETYWAFVKSDNVGYNGHISPIFEEYIPPKFELKCSPKTIKYGEKSTCTLYGTVDVNLTNLNFDFDPKEYKVLGATFPKGIENKKGDKQYNLEISENYDQSKEGFVLGVFELTGAQNKKYTDDVQIINLDYVDAKVKGKYENLKDPIEIVALKESTKELKEEDNPNTASSLSVIIPVVLFVVTVVIFFAVDNKKKIKKIS